MEVVVHSLFRIIITSTVFEKAVEIVSTSLVVFGVQSLKDGETTKSTFMLVLFGFAIIVVDFSLLHGLNKRIAVFVHLSLHSFFIKFLHLLLFPHHRW